MPTAEQVRIARLTRDRAHAGQSKRIARLVREARSEGVTWPLLCEAMDMTEPGLRKFLERHPD